MPYKCRSQSVDKQTEPDKIRGQVQACHQQTLHSLNNYQCLDDLKLLLEEIISQLLGRNRKHGKANSFRLVLNVPVCATARSMSRSNGHVTEGCALSLLALLLRLVLARTDPLKFSVNLDGIKICGSGRKIKRFPA